MGLGYAGWATVLAATDGVFSPGSDASGHVDAALLAGGIRRINSSISAQPPTASTPLRLELAKAAALQQLLPGGSDSGSDNGGGLALATQQLEAAAAIGSQDAAVYLMHLRRQAHYTTADSPEGVQAAARVQSASSSVAAVDYAGFRLPPSLTHGSASSWVPERVTNSAEKLMPAVRQRVGLPSSSTSGEAATAGACSFQLPSGHSRHPLSPTCLPNCLRQDVHGMCKPKLTGVCMWDVQNNSFSRGGSRACCLRR